MANSKPLGKYKILDCFAEEFNKGKSTQKRSNSCKADTLESKCRGRKDFANGF